MNVKWQVIYYVDEIGNNPVKKFLDKLAKKQQGKILRIIQYIQEYGLQSVIPHIKKLTGTPFWEIRILGKDNIRIIYVLPVSNQVLVLHGFIKKKQKTPLKELEIASSRYKSWKLNLDE